MFNKNFYPTPQHVIQQMLFGLELNEATILEPSAGKGDIIDVVKSWGGKVLACEKHPELATITSKKADEFLTYDFFDLMSKDVSHVDYVIMNPPFDKADRHIQHAWEILPEGGQIVALANAKTLESINSRYRGSLKNIIQEFGSYENIGNPFSSAERETDVSVILVRLYKQKSGDNEFEGFFDLTEEDYEGGSDENGLMNYNSIREIVNRYVGAVKKFDEVQSYNKQMNELIEPLGGNHAFEFGCYRKGRANSFMSEVNRHTFKKKLQKQAWESVFERMKMEKYLTKGVMEDINRFVEKQKNVPFTMKNIYKVIEIIIGTNEQRMYKVIEEAFDMITKHHHENRFYVEGWKTNDQYRVGRKFIIPHVINCNLHGYMEDNWRSHGATMDDLNKALCLITGTKFEEIGTLRDFLYKQNREFGKKHEWGFFEIRGYRKGTLHCKFKDEWTWDEFNRVACKAKGFHIAEKYTSDYKRKERDIRK